MGYFNKSTDILNLKILTYFETAETKKSQIKQKTFSLWKIYSLWFLPESLQRSIRKMQDLNKTFKQYITQQQVKILYKF